jgi:hypothetical protein
MIGQVFNSNNCGMFTVIDGPIKATNKTKWRIKFLSTGFEKLVPKFQIVTGQIRDPYVPSVFGIGVVGEISLIKYPRLSSLWRDILSRCYNPNDTTYCTYGNHGVHVNKDWWMLANFIADVPQLPGWDKGLYDARQLQLDKDLLQHGVEPKQYSRDTCVWLNNHDNCIMQDRQIRPFFAIDPNGNKTFWLNISQFARTFSQLGFTRRNVSAVLNRSDVHSCFGWKFEFSDEEIV